MRAHKAAFNFIMHYVTPGNYSNSGNPRDDSASSFDPETSVEKEEISLTHGMPTHSGKRVARGYSNHQDQGPGHLDESFGRTSARTHIIIYRGEEISWHLGENYKKGMRWKKSRVCFFNVRKREVSSERAFV